MNGQFVSVLALGALISTMTPAHAASYPKAIPTDLANGLRVLVIPQPHLPMVVLSATIEVGSRHDPIGQEGLASLTADLLTQGTAKMSGPQMHDAIDFLGARLGASSGDDTTGVSLTVLEKDLDQGLDLLADVIRRPAFPEDEVARKRAETLAAIASREDNPTSLAYTVFRKELQPNGPYRHPSIGWKESVEKLTRNDVRKFHDAGYRPDRTTIVVAGSVDSEAFVAALEKRFGDWKPLASSLEIPPGLPSLTKKTVLVERDLTQANIIWGHRGVTRSDPDWYAIQVMNYILGGGGFSSRLMSSIRNDAGLAYSVYSYFSAASQTGAFQSALQTKAESADEAVALLEKEVERIRTEPVSDEEIENAKKYLIGSFPLKIDSNGKLVSFYSQVAFHDLGLEYPERYEEIIAGLTKADIMRVAKKHLHPSERLLVVVGKQAGINLN